MRRIVVTRWAIAAQSTLRGWPSGCRRRTIDGRTTLSLPEYRVLLSLPAILLTVTMTPPAAPASEGGPPACCRPGGARAAAILAAMSPDASDDAAPAATVDLDPAVTAILDALDAQTLAMRTFASRVRMDSYDDLADETERRFGRVVLQIEPSTDGGRANRIAAVVFERTIEPSGRARERLEHYVYRDGVLSDYDHEAKRLTRRRLVAEGDDHDPLRLGEGPVPIPIAQRKADIVAAFDVSVGPAIPARILSDAADVRGLHLVPKPGTRMAEDGRIAAIDLWVRGDAAEPVAVEIHEPDGDRTALRFLKPTMNQSLGDDDQRRLVPPAVDPGTWRIEES